MIDDKQKKLLEVLAAAWSKRPAMRLGQFIDECSRVWGTGDPAMSSDEDLGQALKDYVGLPKK